MEEQFVIAEEEELLSHEEAEVEVEVASLVHRVDIDLEVLIEIDQEGVKEIVQKK